jgi:hypothetical protein
MAYLLVGGRTDSDRREEPGGSRGEPASLRLVAIVLTQERRPCQPVAPEKARYLRNLRERISGVFPCKSPQNRWRNPFGLFRLIPSGHPRLPRNTEARYRMRRRERRGSTSNAGRFATVRGLPASSSRDSRIATPRAFTLEAVAASPSVCCDGPPRDSG